MIPKLRFFLNCCAVFLLGLILLQSSVNAAQQNVLQQQLQGVENNTLMIDQSEIALADMIKNVYQYNQYKLFWQNKALADTLLNAIKESYQLGLDPEEYHLSELNLRLKKGFKQSGIQGAQLDILLTDALLRLSYHLIFGKVVPAELDADWNLRRDFLTKDPVAKINYILQSDVKLKKFLKQSMHPGPFYQGLIKALAQYRQIQKAGGWQSVPSGATIKPGMTDSRIPQIKARLYATGDLKMTTSDPEIHIYDATIEAGIKHFQQRHNIDADGVIGKGTLAMMNIPVTQRIDQIRANLERVRWVKQNLEEEFVLVNIAGFKVYYVKDNKLVWKSRAQVGKEYRKTPIFKSDINYLVFNPTWTVPPTILRNDVLPKIKRDISYLKKKNMSVLDFKGNIIKPANVNWSSMSAKGFPYMIRQEPGPTNALGRVKFMFPNKHMVYLHDTPSKSNFKKVERAFSSGCIRIENPFELVELLLKDSNKWNQASFQEMLDSGKLKNVNLPQKVPVLLLYFTAQLKENGEVTFFKDIYKRDEKIIEGLRQPFQVTMPGNRAQE